MSRLIFAALTSLAFVRSAAAQRVAGRDLLDFPIGLLADAPALSTQMTGSLWNPAASALTPSTRGAFGLAGLTTPQEQGVKLDMIAGSYAVRPNLTATISAAQASVTDILRTDTDPTSLGGEIPYGTTLISAGAAEVRGNVAFGLTARFRSGVSDADHASELGLDGGVIVDHVAGTPIRVAASTFLFSPWRMSEAPTFMFAADVPLMRRDTTFSLRGGYSISHTSSREDERYVFATSSYRLLDLSAGFARTTEFGNVDKRWRLGCGIRYALYRIAIAREDGAAGVGGSFQFLFTRTIR